MRFQKQQGHQFYGHPASFVNTAFEWECLGSLTRARLMNRGQSNKKYFVPHHRGILSHIRSQTNNNNKPVKPSENWILQSCPPPRPPAPRRVGLRQVIWFVWLEAWQHVLTITLVFQPAASVWGTARGQACLLWSSQGRGRGLCQRRPPHVLVSRNQRLQGHLGPFL